MPASPLQGSPPPGLLEGFVQLPPDSTGKQLRAFPVSVYEQQADGTFSAATTYQQVAVLADPSGNLVGTESFPLYIEADRVEGLLKDIHDVLLRIASTLEELDKR